MTRWITFFLWAALAVVGARGAEQGSMRASKPEVRKEIIAAIEGQLVAFRAGDAVAAYAFAAAELRVQKPLRDFALIVRDSYPEIWANTHAEYGVVRDDGAKAMLAVQVFSQASDTPYDYTLTKERGGWRIHDVVRHEPKKKNQM